MSETKRPVWIWIATVIAVIFGVMTIKSGGSVLFIDGEARQAAGNYVDFVLWFNFLAGFLYIATGIGLWMKKIWSMRLALLLAAATLITFAAFGVYIMNGGAYEMRTVIAMTIRSSVWIIIASTAWFVGRSSGVFETIEK
ncbi:MAG: hypothetical protein ABFS08_04850 [Pseudomonadota bacterium]